MKRSILVISGHYRKNDDGVTIELFGRTKEGRSITVLVNGFQPYFYSLIPLLGPAIGYGSIAGLCREIHRRTGTRINPDSYAEFYRALKTHRWPAFSIP